MFQVEYTKANGDYHFLVSGTIEGARRLADWVENNGGAVLAVTELKRPDPTADQVTMDGRYSAE